jgi:hypothetical protein
MTYIYGNDPLVENYATRLAYAPYMQNVLAWMTENYGSPLGYITQELDVTEEELNELRNKYLE